MVLCTVGAGDLWFPRPKRRLAWRATAYRVAVLISGPGQGAYFFSQKFRLSGVGRAHPHATCLLPRPPSLSAPLSRLAALSTLGAYGAVTPRVTCFAKDHFSRRLVPSASADRVSLAHLATARTAKKLRSKSATAVAHSTLRTAPIAWTDCYDGEEESSQAVEQRRSRQEKR